MCTWIDHTFNEALSAAVTWPQLALIIRYLAQMSVNTGEVSLDDWENYLKLGALEDYALLAYMKKEWRVKIPTSRERYHEAVKSGFYKVTVAVDYTPSLAAVLKEQMNYFTDDREHYVELRDASLYDTKDIIAVDSLLRQYNIRGLIYNDENSGLDDFSVMDNLIKLKEGISVPLEFYGCNAYDLGTSRTLLALNAGITNVHISVGGVGGNAPLEEIWMANKYFRKRGGPPANFADSCRKIINCLNLEVPKSKPIIGKDIFSHESGLHVDGVTKNPILYEAFSPDEVGLTRSVVIGKHSGSAALRYKLKELELFLDNRQISLLLRAVRKLAVGQKTALTDLQLTELYWQTIKEERC